jgi:hypothetical protein
MIRGVYLVICYEFVGILAVLIFDCICSVCIWCCFKKFICVVLIMRFTLCSICTFRYALYVLDNQNLQDTWDLDKHLNFSIANGLMFFHFNRKLCLHKIYNLASHVGIRTRITDSDVSPTNGDLVPCKCLLKLLIVSIMLFENDLCNSDNMHILVSKQNFLQYVIKALKYNYEDFL